MRGRKPVPTVLRELHGNPSHATPRRKEPAAPPLEEPPDDLSPGQRECWLHAVSTAPKGVLRACDRGILRGWAVTEDTYRRASAALGEQELLVDGRDGKVQNLNITICANALRSLARLAELLGYSPVSRVRLAVAAPGPLYGDAEADPNRPTLEDWLEEGKRLRAKNAH